MQLYVSDYLGDTQHLSTEQHGAYLLLLFAMWNAGGSLPSDGVKLARICRLGLKRWQTISGDVLGFFEIKNGKITQKRMLEEIARIDRQHEFRATAGRKGGRAKALRYNNQDLARATAQLEHVRALPYTEEAPSESEPQEKVMVDKDIQPELFAACVRGLGKDGVWQRRYEFPVSVVAAARSELRK